ncbi:endo-1,4-beta-glucanase [Streptomyces sp. Tue 6430]|nr:endo-1,4-beta-glucanase [Streptomyces sp. Tue 6430]
MQHRRPRLSRTAKGLVAAAVALAAAAGVTVAQAGESSRKCAAFDTVTLGKYYVNNNLWNQEKAVGSQCVWDNSLTGSTVSWGTSYDWANSATGKDYDVKSYASTVLGWHWGWKVDKAKTGLPIRVGDRKKVTVSWDFSVSANPGVMNVAHDLWLHDKNTADWQDQPTDEVMIWLNRQGGAGPLGTRYGSVSLGGAMWDIYRGDIGWNVYSFVRRTNTTKATLNLDDFTQALVRRKLLSNDKYVSGVESGTEVFKGKGRLDTKAYAVTVG